GRARVVTEDVAAEALARHVPRRHEPIPAFMRRTLVVIMVLNHDTAKPRPAPRRLPPSLVRPPQVDDRADIHVRQPRQIPVASQRVVRRPEEPPCGHPSLPGRIAAEVPEIVQAVESVLAIHRTGHGRAYSRPGPRVQL